MSPWDTAELLTLAQAAEALGVKHARPGRWLRRYLQRREEATGREIIVNLGDGRGRGSRYYVSMKELRDACPELLQPNRRLELALTGRIGELAHRIERLERAVSEANSHLDEIHDSVRILIEVMKGLNVSTVSTEPRGHVFELSCKAMK